jgi:simple sugar transport system substrate-binding protein
VSIDGVKGAFEAMMAGKLNCTIECSPLLGPQLMSAVKDLVAGKTLPKRILTQESVFPAEVAASEFPKRTY